nr:amidohydrolase motif-containing [Pandoravirus massiliensis]
MRALCNGRLVVRGVSLAGSADHNGPVDVLLERGATGRVLAIGNRESWGAMCTDAHPTHILDARGLVALPGIFNAHLCTTTMHDRRHTAGADGTVRSARRSTHASTLAETMATMVGMLKGGTTSALFPTQAHPEAVIEAAVRVGMRATVAVTAQDSAVRGDPATAAAVDVERVMSLSRRWRPHSTITIALGLDATIAQCRPAYLDAIVGLCSKYTLPVHARVDKCDAPSYTRSIARLDRLALCGARFSVAVCDSLRRGADDVDAPVPVYSRVPPFAHMIDRRRSPWSLAAAVGGGLSCPFERMRCLAKVDGTMGAHDAWRLAVRPGRRARAANAPDHLCVGDAADLALIDPRRFASQSRPILGTTTTTTSHECDNDAADPSVHTKTPGVSPGSKGQDSPFALDSVVRHCQSSDVACVIVAGRIVVAVGTATLVDEHAIVR